MGPGPSEEMPIPPVLLDKHSASGMWVSENIPSETVRKGYKQQSERGFGRYTERKMDRKATPWRPLRLRWERLRDFSDSLSRQLVNKANLPSYRCKLFVRLEAECSARFWRRLFGE